MGKAGVARALIVCFAWQIFVASPAQADGPSTIQSSIVSQVEPPQDKHDDKPEAKPEEKTEGSRKYIEEIDKSIIKNFIKLARFNIQFHINANRHQWWRAYAYPFIREAGGAATFANTLTDLHQTRLGLSDLSLISKHAQKNGLKSAITGSAISGTGSALELAQNAWIMLKYKDIYGPSASEIYVKQVLDATDGLLARRQSAISHYDGTERKIKDVEGQLLAQMRAQLLFEFRKWSVHSRDTAWRENTFYLIDSSQNFATCASSIAALGAFSHPQIRGTVAITALVATAAATANPIVSTAAGACARKIQRRRLLKHFDIAYSPLDETVSPALIQKLRREAAESDSKRVLAESVFLSDQATVMDGALSRETSKIEKLRQIAQEKMVSGSLIGLSGLARSVLVTDAYYNYSKKSVTSNKMKFAGRVSQTVGQSYALVDTPLTFVKSLINNHRLAARDELPSQVFKRRLENLDALEQQLDSEKPFKSGH